MPIVPSSFSRKCVEEGLFFAVQPHYMLAVARLRSHITDDTQGDLVGPFRLTRSDWTANNLDADFDVDVLPTDITNWRIQCTVFALMTYRALEGLAIKNVTPSVVDLYLAQWPTAASKTLVADLQQALDDTAILIGPAVQDVLGETDTPDMSISDVKAAPSSPPPLASTDSLNLKGVTPSRRQYAAMIAAAFGAAGYEKWHQVAAIANAIGESSLNPAAKTITVSEESYGLFQLNRKGGLGAGHSPADLLDPNKNIGFVLAEANRFPLIKAAGSVEAAVALFVQKVERPKDPRSDTDKRIAIAHTLMS